MTVGRIIPLGLSKKEAQMDRWFLTDEELPRGKILNAPLKVVKHWKKVLEQI